MKSRAGLIASILVPLVLALVVAGCGSSSSSSSTRNVAASSAAPTSISSSSMMSSSSAGASSAGSAAAKNIVQVASSAHRFSTLVALVKKAGLVSALEGNGPFTVFAPTNQAFARLGERDPALFDKVVNSKKLLTEVLEYHVAKGRLLASQIVARHSLATLLGKPVTIHVRGGRVYVQRAEVITANILASNGVIHAINAVLIPPA
ncbi:MAG: fasciclin domain-containing protein [Solirubrobacterales bacterium]|nr:fasciclin domain-containing protein [Solirubrobacterales bacterium]